MCVVVRSCFLLYHLHKNDGFVCACQSFIVLFFTTLRTCLVHFFFVRELISVTSFMYLAFFWYVFEMFRNCCMFFFDMCLNYVSVVFLCLVCVCAPGLILSSTFPVLTIVMYSSYDVKNTTNVKHVLSARKQKMTKTKNDEE